MTEYGLVSNCRKIKKNLPKGTTGSNKGNMRNYEITKFKKGIEQDIL